MDSKRNSGDQIVKLGTFLMPVHPPEKSRTACFDEELNSLFTPTSLDLQRPGAVIT